VKRRKEGGVQKMSVYSKDTINKLEALFETMNNTMQCGFNSPSGSVLTKEKYVTVREMKEIVRVLLED
jgi:hypothetical protein